MAGRTDRPTQPFGVTRWPTAESRMWAEQAFVAICADPDVLALVLIGSAARPIAVSHDVDCLLIHRGEPPRLPPAPVEVPPASEPSRA